MAPSSTAVSRPQLSVCSFLTSPALVQQLDCCLDSQRFALAQVGQVEDFLRFVDQGKHKLDCLILEASQRLPEVVGQLHRSAILLPTIILNNGQESPQPAAVPLFHTAEVQLPATQMSQLPQVVERAIAQFLNLSLACPLPAKLTTEDQASPSSQVFLATKQQRLAEKLKERLGYLGIYYKRDPQHFLRHLSESDRQQFLEELNLEYRDIVLHYFRKDSMANQKIDQWVTKAFFADMSVSQVLEIHMNLMDTFAKQLKLEGRSEEILLDYRLTLIDTIAHLCEMYRRSIPRE